MIRSLIHFELYLFLCIYEEEDECSLCYCPFVFVEVDLGLIFLGCVFRVQDFSEWRETNTNILILFLKFFFLLSFFGFGRRDT